MADEVYLPQEDVILYQRARHQAAFSQSWSGLGLGLGLGLQMLVVKGNSSRCIMGDGRSTQLSGQWGGENRHFKGN